MDKRYSILQKNFNECYVCGAKMKEKWKDIKDYKGLYQVSNLGRVKSLYKWDVNKRKYIKKSKILKLNIRNGYYTVQLTKNKKRLSKQVHRLVGETFLKKEKNKNIINHKDFNRLNNNVNNLEWCTQKENVNHSICNMKKRKNITHSNTKEKYITYRKSKNTYRITIDKKEYGCKTLEEAIKKRDEILNEKI